MESLEWKILCLNVDNSSKEISNLFRIIWPEKVSIAEPGVRISSDLTRKQLIGKTSGLTTIGKENILTVYGHGKFHHYTYGLCHNIADKKSENYCYIHFDAHSDDYDYQPGKPINANDNLTCASFTHAILSDLNAKCGIFIGSEPTFEKRVYHMGCMKQKELESFLEGVPHDVYMSFDLDVLRTGLKHAYNSGGLCLSHLISAVDIIKGKKNVIGADILGYAYERDIQSNLTYVILAKKIMGEDTTKFERFSRKVGKKTSYDEFLELVTIASKCRLL